MGKSRHRRDYDNYDDEEFYHRSNKFRDRRNRRLKKMHEHEESLNEIIEPEEPPNA